ncbi:MAG: signal peptidase I [Planctomycetes bacterium]|nr:signal peptidase I [Planctomycetota bacterium]
MQNGKQKPASEPAKSGTPQTTPASETPRKKSSDSSRETIESIVVAFVLAFLFRTFEAEAFVIPTGSMAPTLYGQHRDTVCEQCGTRFATGVDSSGTSGNEIRDGEISAGSRSQFAICANANCRYPNNVLDREMFAGDRILVNKFPYEFHDPERWDVVVFKFPESAKTNYIKRLVGLPGEELKISGGDIWTRKLDEQGQGVGIFEMARKPPEKQRQIQLLVHDNDCPATKLLATGWPESWAPEEEQGTGWVADTKARSFRVDPVTPGDDHEDWLRYTHYVPTVADWARADEGNPPRTAPKPQLVTDFYAYNNRVSVNDYRRWVDRDEGLGGESPLWVGDLTLTCTIDVLQPGGEVILELVEGQRRYRCRIDLKTGRGQLEYTPELTHSDEEWKDAGEAFDTPLNKPGTYKVSFANVDDRLCVWVDDKLAKEPLDFKEGSKYPPQFPPIRSSDADHRPVGICARGAKLRVSHLKIERDIYYSPEPQTMNSDQELFFKMHRYADNSANDEFLMLGDNSPRSNDSRLWAPPHTVARHLLIGKAFFVYWPHAVPFLNDGRGFPVFGQYIEPRRSGSGEPPGPPIPKFSVPFYPNFGRMHRIR